MKFFSGFNVHNILPHEHFPDTGLLNWALKSLNFNTGMNPGYNSMFLLVYTSSYLKFSYCQHLSNSGTTGV